MGQKTRVVNEPLNTALEIDAIRQRHVYCYTQNRPAIVAWVKRHIHKRARRREKEEVAGILDELASESQRMGFYDA